MNLISVGHSALLTDLAMCLNWYRLASPGLYCCVRATLELPDGHVYAPDVLVMVNHGEHKSATPEPEFERFRGAPNLIVDVYPNETSRQYEERHQRLTSAGVGEYLAVFDTQPLTWRWHTADDSGLGILKPVDGVLQSSALPGLWVPEAAFAARDWWTIMATITRGVSRRGHHDYMNSIWYAGNRKS